MDWDSVTDSMICGVRASISEDSDIESRFDFASSFHGKYGSTFYPIQKREECLGFAREAESLCPSRIIEIGTGNGGMALVLAGTLSVGGTLVTVDLPNDAGGGPEWKDAAIEAIPSRGKIRTVRGNSQDENTAIVVSDIIGGQADVIFVDGEHTLTAVGYDFNVWSPLLRNGGIMGFHDITTRDIGAFWLRLTRNIDGEFTEFVEDWNMVGYGIGIWRKPNGD